MRLLHSFWRGIFVALACTTLAYPTITYAQPPFSPPQLSQLAAPIALYPDSLLTQILMASTYPDNVVEAAYWSRKHSNLKGDLAVAVVQKRPWDPSVQSLVAFPQVLAMMGSHPAWVRDLGDAFLAQPEALMDTVQRLRVQAQRSGALRSTKHLKVVSTAPKLIVIEPVSPSMVYVPYYDPGVVYGSWEYPAYPPVRIPPPVGFSYPQPAVDNLLVFGIGVAATHALWGGYNWARHATYINVPQYNHITIHNQINISEEHAPWQHHPQFRAAPYRTPALRERFEYLQIAQPHALLPQIIQGKTVPPEQRHKHEADKHQHEWQQHQPQQSAIPPQDLAKLVEPHIIKTAPIVRGEIKRPPKHGERHPTHIPPTAANPQHRPLTQEKTQQAPSHETQPDQQPQPAKPEHELKGEASHKAAPPASAAAEQKPPREQKPQNGKEEKKAHDKKHQLPEEAAH